MTRKRKQQESKFVLDTKRCRLVKLTPDYCDTPLFNPLQGKTVSIEVIAELIAKLEEDDNIIAYIEFGNDCIRKHETNRDVPLDLTKAPYATAEDVKVDRFGLFVF